MRLKNRYRHLKRLKEIVNILTKFGLGQLVAALGLQDKLSWYKNSSEEVESLDMPVRLRMAIEELGPAFIKLGQLLSTRSDLIAQPIIDQLTKLQDQVEGVSFEQIVFILQEELGVPYEEIFSDLEPIPLASASIGQVHKGRLTHGEEVVVKVQRPGVKAKIAIDLDILLDLAKTLEAKTRWGKFYNVTDLAMEFIEAINEESDYLIEAQNSERIRAQFKKDNTVKIPKVIMDYTTSRVLVMEYVHGVKISEKAELLKKNFDCNLLAHRIANAIFRMIFINGFFHADPHPGNLAVTQESAIVLMDFGLVGRLDDHLKEDLSSLALSIVRKDSQSIADRLIQIGQARSKVNRDFLAKDISKLMDRYYAVSMAQLKLGEILQKMLNMAYGYKIRIPAEITLLAKTLVTLEGIVLNLDRRISIIELAEPFAQRLIMDRYSPPKVRKRLIRNTMDIFRTTYTLPHRINVILEKLEDGELVLGLHHRYFQDYIQQLNSISNRLAFSIVIAALIIGSSVITRGKNSYLLNRLPIAEVGYVVAVILGFSLIFSILRSRRF